MTQLKIKAGTFVATSALVLSFVPGVFAASDVDVTVTGNGAGSTQEITVKDISKESVKQSNTTEVVNIQNATSSTGGNKIVGSTGEGSSNSITSGNAKATNVLKVTGGSNTVVVDPCGCEPSSVTVHASGNGADSDTKVKVIEKSDKKTKQKTYTSVYNEQDAQAKTGKNKIKNSTGTDGDTIETGKATTKNKAVVKSGSNFVGPTEIVE